MAESSFSYERLPGVGHHSPLPRWGLVLVALVIGPLALLVRGARQELWCGPDHLLVVDRSAYAERYRRIRFSEIQAIQNWLTPDFLLTAIVVGWTVVVTGALTVGSIIQGADPVITTSAGLVTLAAATGFAFHLYHGRTCTTRLQTAVQVLDIPAWGRLKAAHHAMAQIRKRIADAQGTLATATPSGIEAAMAPPPVASFSDPASSLRTHPPANLRVHGAVAYLCLAEAFMAGLAFPLTSPWFDALGVILGLMHLGVCIWAIRVQRHGWWPPMVTALPKFALGNLIFSLALTFEAILVLIITMGAGVEDVDWRELPALVTGMTLTSGFDLAIGLIGIRELGRFRARIRRLNAARPVAPDNDGIARENT